VRWLRARGLEAYSLQGGITAWKAAGYPLESPAAEQNH
jgi:rhodanese-related sulfurtransferase